MCRDDCAKWESFDDLPATEWLNFSLLNKNIEINENPSIDESFIPSHFPPLPEFVDFVIFHAPCADGTAAAFAVAKRFPNATLVGVNRGVSERYLRLPDNVAGSHIVLVDYVYPELLLEELASVAASITVIDHHPSELPLLRHFEIHFPSFKFLFAEHVCAAILAWRWVFPDTPFPLLYHYINDNDTGTWDLVNIGNFFGGLNVDAPVFSAEIFTFPDFWIFQDALNRGAEYIRSRVVLGMIARLTDRRDVKQIAQRSSERRLAAAPHLVCRAVNSSDLNGSLHRALLSGTFADDRRPSDISMQYYYIDATGGWKIALRSHQESDVDVGEIARFYGGGGHKHAASFSWDDDLDSVFIEKEEESALVGSSESKDQNWKDSWDTGGNEWKQDEWAKDKAEWKDEDSEAEDYSELDRGWTFAWTKSWYRQ